MNETLRFKFAITSPQQEEQEEKTRRLCGKIAVACWLVWILCLFLRVPHWVATLFQQLGATFLIIYFVRRMSVSSLKERARWGGIDLDARELVVNTLDGPKQKIPLYRIESWKIRRNRLVVGWTKPEKTWFKNRRLTIPFQALENPEEFLTQFEKNLSATKNQATSQ